jgi:hypothetical protein
MIYIFRLVQAGAVAANVADDDLDLESPTDLVMLTTQSIDDGGEDEIEIDRQSFATGADAQRRLFRLLRGGDADGNGDEDRR